MSQVLIVDDIEQDLQLLKILLEAHSHDVITARNGVEALRIARLTPPDLIVTEIPLPEMDGLQLCRHWKSDAVLKDKPLVFYTEEQKQELALDLGADDFILKQIKPTELLAAIHSILDQQHGGEPRRLAAMSARADSRLPIEGNLQRRIEGTLFERQARNAYCPGCGSSAILDHNPRNGEHGEFQLICNTCDSCWNLKPVAAQQTLAPPQFSQRGDSRQASAARMAQPSGAAMTPRNPAELLTLLTERQKEVMDLVVAGKANKQTAHILGLSEKTVERHRANLMRRLGVRNIVDLVRLHMLTTGQIANSSTQTFTTADAGHQESC